MLFPTMRVQIVHGPAAPGGAATDKALGDLPEWNLDDLYPGIESAPLRSDLERAFADAQALAEPPGPTAAPCWAARSRLMRS